MIRPDEKEMCRSTSYVSRSMFDKRTSNASGSLYLSQEEYFASSGKGINHEIAGA